MKAITYRLHALEPVLASQAETGEENSAIGLSFIPGSALRGAVVARYLQDRDPGDLAQNPETRALFLDDTVCFLNAYPCPAGERLLPRPLSWFTEKDMAAQPLGTLYDWAVDPEADLKQAKPPKDADFCALVLPEEVFDLEALAAGKSPETPEARFYKPPRQVNVHIALVEPNTRTDANKVYRYDALAAEEVLAGAIIAPDDFDLSLLRDLLAADPDLFLGGARTAGYGHVRVEEPRIVEDWIEYPAGQAPEDFVVVTLLSDAILRGPDGQHSTDLSTALAERLGVSDLKTQRKYQRVDLVGGFNRKWGLPLVQTWALQAGSVLVYDAQDVDAASLRAAVESGVGERRAEGFGRVAVNWHTASVVNWTRLKGKVQTSAELSEASRALAQQMAQRHLTSQLESGLVAFVSRASVVRAPQNTQLSRVRNAVRQALLESDLELVDKHLKGLKDAKKQFETARIDGVPLLSWLEARITRRDVQKQLLGGRPLPHMAGVEAQLTPELEVEYTARLIDGVMKKAIRKNQEAAA